MGKLNLVPPTTLLSDVYVCSQVFIYERQTVLLSNAVLYDTLPLSPHVVWR